MAASKNTPLNRAMGFAVARCQQLNEVLRQNREDDPFWQPSTRLHYIAGKSGRVGCRVAKLQSLSGNADMADAMCVFNGVQWVPSALDSGFCMISRVKLSNGQTFRQGASWSSSYINWIVYNFETGIVIDNDSKIVDSPVFHEQRGLYYGVKYTDPYIPSDINYIFCSGNDTDYFDFATGELKPNHEFILSGGFWFIDDYYDPPGIGSNGIYQGSNIKVKDLNYKKESGCLVGSDEIQDIKMIDNIPDQNNIQISFDTISQTAAICGTTLFEGIDSEDLKDDVYYSIMGITQDSGSSVEGWGEFSAFSICKPSIDGDLWTLSGLATEEDVSNLLLETGAFWGVDTNPYNIPYSPSCVATYNSWTEFKSAFGYSTNINNALNDPGFDYPIITSRVFFVPENDPKIVHIATARGSVIRSCINFLYFQMIQYVEGGSVSNVPEVIIVNSIVEAKDLGLDSKSDFVFVTANLYSG